MRNLIIFVLGTRPEVIKLYPVLREVKKQNQYDIKVISTGQQRDLTNQVARELDLRIDLDLNLMESNQSPNDFLARCLKALHSKLNFTNVSGVVVQGDTTSALAGALVGFHLKKPIFHVEAGLRTNNLFAPHPEEGNRRLISTISALHFAPTQKAKEALIRQGIPQSDIILAGNTVVDMHRLFKTSKLLGRENPNTKIITPNNVLVTLHRRENHQRISSYLKQIRRTAREMNTWCFWILKHPNPNVLSAIEDFRARDPNIKIIDPLPFLEFQHFLKKMNLVITDSGGLQEEAASWNIPCLVVRESTERSEGVETGHARMLVDGLENLSDEMKNVLESLPSDRHNPYGDGYASVRIVEAIGRHLNHL